MQITVDIVIYDGFKALETIAALTAFRYANMHLEQCGMPGRYDIKLASGRQDRVMSDIGVTLLAEKTLDPLAVPHTTIVVGTWEVEGAVVREESIVHWLEATKQRVKRTAGLCSGAFFLAEAGLLNDRRATTHWAIAEAMKAKFPAVRVEVECIFIKDGPIWTSAGVTAGIDLALAMVEEDFGTQIALDVARDLVVYLKRAGGQSQLSSHLISQGTQQPGIREIQDWILANLASEVRISALADRVSMSVRNLNRCFRRETGMTPSAFLTRARIEAAQRLLEHTELPAKSIAAKAGFRTYEAMRRVFRDELSQSPLDYRASVKANQREAGHVERRDADAPRLTTAAASGSEASAGSFKIRL